MLPPRCPNCGCPATGPALHGTPLVLCPACWTVVDPAAPPAPPPKPRGSPVLAETPELEPLPESSDSLPDLPVFDLARLPPRPPPMRSGPSFRRILLIVFVLQLAPGVWYGLRVIDARYPGFRAATAPGGEFTLAFPGEPYWHATTTGDTSDVVRLLGHFTRHYRDGRQEVYAVSVGRCPAPRDRQEAQMFALAKATELARANMPLAPGTAHLGKLTGCACADFEKPPGLNDGDQWVAGRVVVNGDRYYVLAASGPDVRLGDWRVRRFIGSFTLGSR